MSVRELATLTGRTEAGLSRTLKRFTQLGIVAFENRPRRTRAPALIATHVHLEIDLTGHRSAVAVDARGAGANPTPTFRAVSLRKLSETI